MRPYLCIVDFESTCWSDRKPVRRGGGHIENRSEIIEFGAVMARTSTLDKVSEFQSFVRPQVDPFLSDFCKTLTTIQQKDVDAAPAFPEVLGRFHRWLGKGRDYCDVEFCSWGRYDFNKLREDCDFHKVPWPFYTNSHINLKDYMADRMGCKPKGLGSAIDKLKLTLEGTHHRGIDDARNILRIVRKVGLK